MLASSVTCRQEPGISCEEDGHVVAGLYRQTTCIRYPTLAILGLTDVNSPWINADIQSKYVCSWCDRALLEDGLR